MEEIWKPVTVVSATNPNGSLKYEVSNLGRVRSSSRLATSGSYIFLKPREDCVAALRCDDGQDRSFAVSFLVASAFVPNPNGYQYVSYKDGNKRNCVADNLEWIPNRTFGLCSKPVNQFSLSGEFIARFNSMSDAARASGISAYFIRGACKAGVDAPSRAGDFLWSFAERIKKSSEAETPISNTNTVEVRQYTPDGVLVKVWPSVKLAGLTLGLNRGSISHCCGRKCKCGLYGGFIWRRATDDEFAERNGLGVVQKRVVRQYTLRGKLVAEYSSPIVASREVGCCRSSIVLVCKRDGKHHTAGGYIWRYSTNDELASI